MEPKAHHVIIGLFTVAAVAAALFFALWLGRSDADREWAYYQIRFHHTVSGLSKGNPVKYSGVDVGDVVDMELDPNDPREVLVLVRVDRTVPIRENTRAGLILTNITGSMSIQFTGGSRDSPILDGDRKHPPLIVAEPSLFTNLLEETIVLVGKANRILEHAGEVFSPENTANLTAILENTRVATEALLANRDTLEALLDRLDAAGSRAEEAAIKVSTVSDNANALLQQEGKEALTAMAGALTSLQATSDRLNELTGNNEASLEAGLQGLGELTPALKELRHTLRNLSRISQRIGDDPAGLLWGPETIKELPQ